MLQNKGIAKIQEVKTFFKDAWIFDKFEVQDVGLP